jgi:uncharacterized repeat protein (TIGR03803 family)
VSTNVDGPQITLSDYQTILGWEQADEAQWATLTSVTEQPATGKLFLGDTMTVTLGFAGDVTVTGAPELILNDGGTATYDGGSGSSALTFSYTVVAGNTPVASLAVSSVNLNGGTIDDSAGDSVDLSLGGLTQNGPAIDVPVLATLAGTTEAGSFGGGLIADAAGDLFGTSFEGGPNGGGYVFEIAKTASGYASVSILVSFNGADFQNAHGASPQSSLIADAAGDLFGTTRYGGSISGAVGQGDGTVFEIAKTAGGYAATPTILVSFNGADGLDPTSGLIADAAGDLFGTTGSGGPNDDGVVFEIAKTAGGYATTPTILGAFDGSNGRTPLAGGNIIYPVSGAVPSGALIADAAGDLFGTTAYGGSSSGDATQGGPVALGDGTVFEIAKTAGGYAATPTVLVSFTGANGSEPANGLIADAAGDLFGTTLFGGANGDGVVFEIVKTAGGYASTPTVLASFNGADGTGPSGGLIADASGNLYGTTSQGGPNNEGVVFEIAKTAGGYASTPTVLAVFNGQNGSYPAGSLIADAAGDLFDTSAGAVFELTGAQFVTPQVAAVMEAPSGQVAAGTLITFALDWNEAVTVTGAPTLTLSNGGTATLASGSGSHALIFDYTVGPGGADDATLTPTALILGGGSIHDAIGNVADLSLAGLSVSDSAGIVVGSGGNQTLTGAGNDIFFLGGGNDTINGGSGLNTAVFTGPVEQYTVSQSGGAITVTDSLPGRDGTDTLNNVQQAEFSDITLVFDLHSSEDLLVYELYQAAYDRVPDNAGYRYWAGVADVNKLSGLNLADAFLAAPEFTQRYGANPTNLQYVTELYTNVLGRAPDQAGLNFWVGVANSGTPKDQLLIDFATSAENVSLIGSHVSEGYWTTH